MNPSPIVKPCLEKVISQGNDYCVFDQNQVNAPEIAMFTSQFWQQNNAVTGSAQGRGTTWFVKHNQQEWVLRHYYRGGLIGKMINDQYVYTGMSTTRAAKEFALLVALQAAGLPAPAPIGYRVQKNGLTYRADLLSERIKNAQDLVAILSQTSLEAEQWHNIGKVIQQFHHHGVYHHDLNAHNILIDNADKVWLIDFDQGEQRENSGKWQQANLSRLQRSFLKEREKLAQFHWQETDWQHLLEGYLSA